MPQLVVPLSPPAAVPRSPSPVLATKTKAKSAPSNATNHRSPPTISAVLSPTKPKVQRRSQPAPRRPPRNRSPSPVSYVSSGDEPHDGDAWAMETYVGDYGIGSGEDGSNNSNSVGVRGVSGRRPRAKKGNRLKKILASVMPKSKRKHFTKLGYLSHAEYKVAKAKASASGSALAKVG